MLMRACLLTLLFGGSLFLSGRTAGADDKGAVELTAKLSKIVMVEQPIESPLGEVLAHFTERYSVHGKIVLNEKAFKAEGVEQPREQPIRLEKMTGVKLSTVLDMICKQVDGACVVRANHVEITTQAARRAEMNLHEHDPNTPHRATLPVVRADFSKVPLEKALDQLARKHEWTIILAPQVMEKSETSVSARFVNVPLDTVVELLADMADLKLVRKDNALYVTTPERAEAFAAQEVKRLALVKERESAAREDAKTAAAREDAKTAANPPKQ